MAKLYEIVLRKIGLMEKPKEIVQEELVYNPIKAKVGSFVNLDVLDYRGLNFFVKEIHEWKVSGNTFVDYVLLARPISGGDKTCRLRLVPNTNLEEQFTHTAILLDKYDSLAYEEGLHNVVKDQKSDKFIVDEPEKKVHDEFFRVSSGSDGFEATVTVLCDLDGSGKVDQNEVKRHKTQFWDYSRNAKIDGVNTDQFLFVEMNKDNGWFEIWKGAAINPSNVDLF